MSVIRQELPDNAGLAMVAELLRAMDEAGAVYLDEAPPMRGSAAPLMAEQLNAMPRQDRASQTVARLLDAARSVGMKVGSPEFTVKDVADHAGVGMKTAYRYFSSPGDMVRMAVRQHVRRLFAAYRLYLNGLTETSDEQIARSFAEMVSSGYLRMTRLPPRLLHKLLLEYHDISFQDQWLLAGTIVETLRRCGAGQGLVQESQARLAMALTSVAGSAKMAGLADPRMLRTAYFRKSIETALLGALRHGPSEY